jgi:hypothetical protein
MTIEINIFALIFLVIIIAFLGIALHNVHEEYHLLKGWPEKPKEQDTEGK